MNDSLGDRIKSYEAVSTSRKAFKGQPFCVRLDGKAFHTFCRGLKRPYDERLSRLMVECAKDLVAEFGALVGYTQSDEVNLGFYLPADSVSDHMLHGRFQKLESLTAARITAKFNQLLPAFIPEKAGKLALFDSRAFVVPNIQELYHVFLWRQQDACKNAISMAAQSMFSHKSLQGKHGDEMQEMMFKEKGVNFNDYPAFFKRGTFVRRTTKEIELTPEQIAKSKNKATTAIRSFMSEEDIWLSKELHPVAKLFGVKNWMAEVKSVMMEDK